MPCWQLKTFVDFLVGMFLALVSPASFAQSYSAKRPEGGRGCGLRREFE